MFLHSGSAHTNSTLLYVKQMDTGSEDLCKMQANFADEKKVHILITKLMCVFFSLLLENVSIFEITHITQTESNNHCL